MSLKIKWIKLVFFFVLLILFSGTMLFAQETEIFKMAVSDISKPMFDPETDTNVTIKGQIMYLTKAGTFDEPEITAKISEVNENLGVTILPLIIDDLPPEYKGLVKGWDFTVDWDGRDMNDFLVKPGRYTCVIEAKILKKEVIVEKDASGQEVETTVEKESIASASAPILIVEISI